MAVECWNTLGLAKLVSKECKVSRLGDGWVFLSQTSSTRITWVCRNSLGLLPLRDALFVLAFFIGLELLKGFDRHIHLAPHFKNLWDLASLGRSELLRNYRNGLYVFGDVFTNFSVTSRGSLHEHTILVSNTHSQAINLQFANQAHGLRIVQPFCRPLAPSLQFVDIHCVIQAGHRCSMRYWLKSCECRCAHLGCWRIQRDQAGVLSFQSNEFALQFVVLGITYFGCIVSEVLLVVFVDDVA